MKNSGQVLLKNIQTMTITQLSKSKSLPSFFLFFSRLCYLVIPYSYVQIFQITMYGPDCEVSFCFISLTLNMLFASLAVCVRHVQINQ